MATEAQGTKARMYAKDGAGTPNWTTGTIRSFPFYRESMQKIGSVVHQNVITGDRSEHGERARKGPNVYRGTITFGVSPGELAFWAPYFMGSTNSGTSFPLSANALLPFGILIDKVTETYEFSSCYVDKCLIVGRQSGPGGAPNFLTMQLTIIALDYAADVAAPNPAVDIPTISGEYVPLVFEDTASAITIKASARETKQFAIMLDNFVQARYINDLDPSILYPLHRRVSLQTRHPFDSATLALDDVALSASAGGTITATNGSVSVIFTFGLLQLISQTPTVPGKVEIDIVQNFVSRMTGSTREFAMTIDSTV